MESLNSKRSGIPERLYILLTAELNLKIVEVETFRLAFFVVGDNQFTRPFTARTLFLFQLALRFLFELFLPLFLPRAFSGPLGSRRSRASSHNSLLNERLLRTAAPMVTISTSS